MTDPENLTKVSEADGMVTYKTPPKQEYPTHKKLEKIIYASRKGKTKEEVLQILGVEIDTFHRNNPRYGFEKFAGKPVMNKDLSQTYTLIFNLKL